MNCSVDTGCLLAERSEEVCSNLHSWGDHWLVGRHTSTASFSSCSCCDQIQQTPWAGGEPEQMTWQVHPQGTAPHEFEQPNPSTAAPQHLCNKTLVNCCHSFVLSFSGLKLSNYSLKKYSNVTYTSHMGVTFNQVKTLMHHQEGLFFCRDTEPPAHLFLNLVTTLINVAHSKSDFN